MPVIDQNITWRLAEQRLEVETDPDLRRNLDMLITHQKAEMTMDIDALMATISEKAYYQFFGSGQEPLDGKPAVRKFYQDFKASGAEKLQFDTKRLVVDKHCILTEGEMRIAYPGRTLQARGIDVDDIDAYYLYETDMAILWPIDPDDGLFVAEDSYTGDDGMEGIASRKLSDDDIRLYEPPPA